MAEMIDIYNDEAVKIGCADREYAHRHGLWHKTLHLWIISKVAGKNIVLMQLRGSRVKDKPRKLDATSAGHYRQGEALLDGLRELREELRLEVSVDQLIPLGLRMTASYNEKTGQTNREFQDMYFIRIDRPLREYDFNTDEVDGLVAVEAKDGIRLYSGEIDVIAGDARYISPEDGAQKVIEERIEVRKGDIISVKDNYYYKVFIMAELYLNGWAYVSI